MTARLTFAGGERAHPVLRCRRKDTAGVECGPLSLRLREKGAFLWRLDTVSLGKNQRNGVELALRGNNLEKHSGAHEQA